MLRVKTNARAIVNQMVHLCNIQNYPFFAIQLILIYKKRYHFKKAIKCYMFEAPSKVSTVKVWKYFGNLDRAIIQDLY